MLARINKKKKPSQEPRENPMECRVVEDEKVLIRGFYMEDQKTRQEKQRSKGLLFFIWLLPHQRIIKILGEK
jgi:hypothetical protein